MDMRIIAMENYFVQIIFVLFFFSWRLPKRRYFYLRIISAIAVAMVAFPFVPSIPTVGFINPIFLIMFFTACFIIALSFKIGVRQILVYGIAAAALQNITALLTIILFSFALQEWVMTWLFLLITEGIFGLLFIVFYKIFLRQTRNEANMKVGHVKFISLLISTIMVVFVFVPLIEEFITETAGYVAAISLAVLVNLIILLAEFGIFEESQMEKDNELIERLLRVHREQQQDIEKKADLINLKCHDMKYRLAALKITDSEDEKSKIVDDLKSAIADYGISAKTGNKALDVLISEYAIKCRDNNIRFTYMVDGERLSFMDSADLYSLCANAFENAIKALVIVTDNEKKLLTFNVRKKNGFIFIEMENFCNSEVVFVDGLPKTTQEDTTYHGYGMRCMKYVVEKYRGVLNVSLENNFFSLKAVIPLPTD